MDRTPALDRTEAAAELMHRDFKPETVLGAWLPV